VSEPTGAGSTTTADGDRFPAGQPEGTPTPSASTAPPVVVQRSTPMMRFSAFTARYGVLVTFAVVILVFSLAKPSTFPTADNLKAILETAAPSMVIAVGLTILLVVGDFDLSFGSMISLAGACAAYLMSVEHVSWVVAILACLGLGLGAGLVNGFIVSYLGGSSFIITLAMGTVLTGVEFAIAKQKTIFSGISPDFAKLSQTDFLGVNTFFWISLIVAALIWILLDRTELGRYMYAIGGNPEAARLSGVRTRALRLTAFVLVAMAAAIVGILLTANSASYSPNFGSSYLLPAYAGAFLGSAVLRPGQFNLPGTVIGVLLLGVIQTGLTMLNLQTFVINLVQGAILIGAVLLSRLGQRTA
jgi:ribose transport system permease protein